MFRPFLKVARPEDWTGRMATLATAGVLIMLVLAALMARLPPAVEELSAPGRLMARSGLILLSAWIVMWLRAAVYSRLPRAVWLWRKTLSLPARGNRVRLSVEEVEEVWVERSAGRENQEVFAIRLLDGRRFDLCPVQWEGAGQLYRALARRVLVAHRRGRRASDER